MTAFVGEKLVSKPGITHTRVYRAVCHDCAWIADNWGTPQRAEESARVHNGAVHRYWGQVKMKINEEKAPTMRDKKTIDTAIEVAEARLAALLDERAKLDKLPAEPAENGTIVQFNIQSDTHGPTYSYAAIRANSKWWLTGKETGGRSWDELLVFMAQDWRVTLGVRKLRMSVFYPGTGDVLKASD